MGAQKLDAAHRLFTAYGFVQQGSYFCVDLSAAHVAVLGHRHLGVPELVGADPSGQAGIVDHRGHRLAEAVTGDFRHTKIVADPPPLLVEVVWVAPGARGRR